MMRYLRLNGEEECGGYMPANPMYRSHGIHSSVYYSYKAEFRERDLRKEGEEFPELALVIECINEMGLFSDCAEMLIWSEFCEGVASTCVRHDREWMPKIVRAIEAVPTRDRVFRELYFTFVIPVVAAMDAGEADVAYGIYSRTIEKLKRDWLGD